MRGLVAYKLVAYKKTTCSKSLCSFSISRFENVYFFNVNIFFKCKCVRINGYSFKYVCVKCCLKICFYCLTFSTMSNMNSADFTTPNSHHRFQFFKKRCCLSSKIRRILTWWDLIDAFWIRLRIVKDRFVKYRFVRYTFRFVRYRFPRVSILLVSIMSSRRLPDMSSRRLPEVLEDVKLLRWRSIKDVFKTNKCLLR